MRKISFRNLRLGPLSVFLIFLFLSSLALFSSCEKEVHINLKPGSEKVVVEGNIEAGLPPFIVLTKTIDFFSKIDLSILEDIFLHDAQITVSDGQRTINLKEYAFNNNNYTFYIYTIDSSDLSAFNFRGEYGKDYHLKITYQGKTYESTTSIPFGNGLDSLWVAPPDFPSEATVNSVTLYGQYSDPDTLGNKVRYFTKRNSGEFLAPFFSTLDDGIINGTTVPVRIYPGYVKTDTMNRETFGYFTKGDTVIVKWSSIDKDVFDFWRTLEFSATATGNPFAAPVEVSTNISGGALGVWAGYGSTYDTLVIPY